MNKKILPKTKTGSDISLDTWNLDLDHSLEAQEIEAWNQKDLLAEFDEDIKIHLKDAKNITEISFMCGKPQNCDSHKQYGECCKCIRENFDSPNAYKHWQTSISNLLESEVHNFLLRNVGNWKDFS